MATPVLYPESSGFLVSGRSPGETLEHWTFYGRNPAVTSSWFCHSKQPVKKNHYFFTPPESLLAKPFDQEA